jgi:uncharacterized protein (DUF58 family)
VNPTRTFLALSLGWLTLAVLASLWPSLVFAWQLSGWSLLALALIDALLAWRLDGVDAARSLPGTLPLGVWTEVRVRVQNLQALPRTLRIFDHHPTAMSQRGLPQTIKVSGRAWAELAYQVQPEHRGSFVFGAFQILALSPLRFWWRDLRRGQPTPVRVYPNFAAVKKYALLAVNNRLAQLGVHQKRRRGEGMEFHQLREYRDGDSMRQVDWKATARQHKLISREYQDERDQQIIFLLDCGRRMRALDGALSHFDHTLNAVLLLSYVALREGDGVGLMSFAGDEERWLPPHKTPSALNKMLNALFDLQPSTRATDYLAAAESAAARIKKRALVVLVTNVRDEDDDTLGPALALLRQRHRVLLASLRERALEQTLLGTIRNLDDALQHGAIFEYLDQRRRGFEKLTTHGVRAMDLLPEQLPLALVNRYFELKREGGL